MTSQADPLAGTNRVRLGAVAMPAAHGAWSFLGEALLFILLATPGPAAAPLTLLALAGFLAHQPLRLWLADRLRQRSVPRTRVAARVAASYGLAAGAGLALALVRAPRPGPLLAPLTLALALAAAQLALDARGRGRTLAAELLGAAAPGGVVAAAAAGHDLSAGAAATLWAVLLARGLPAVLFVRARLRLDRGEPASVAACHAAHLAALAGALSLVAVGALPTIAAVVFAVLSLRAVVGLKWRGPLQPRVVGIGELVVGLAAAIVLGSALGGAATPRSW